MIPSCHQWCQSGVQCLLGPLLLALSLCLSRLGCLVCLHETLLGQHPDQHQSLQFLSTQVCQLGHRLTVRVTDFAARRTLLASWWHVGCWSGLAPAAWSAAVTPSSLVVLLRPLTITACRKCDIPWNDLYSSVNSRLQVATLYDNAMTNDFPTGTMHVGEVDAQQMTPCASALRETASVQMAQM